MLQLILCTCNRCFLEKKWIKNFNIEDSLFECRHLFIELSRYLLVASGIDKL